MANSGDNVGSTATVEKLEKGALDHVWIHSANWVELAENIQARARQPPTH